MFRIVATALALVLVVPACLTAIHLGVMALASLFFRDRRQAAGPPVRFLVVIPAHNEERLLPATLTAIGRSLRPGDQVMVVDDRSTDRTADIADEFGAITIRRPHDAEPGRAAARQTAIERARSLEWDAMVMIDADSIVEPDFLDRCQAALADGTQALQARSEAARGKRLVDQAALTSFAIQGVMLPRGREVCHLPVRLRGTGMVLRRELMDRLDFRAKASEDLQVSLDLLSQGVRTRHVERARMRSANADSWKIASTQKQRYEAGRTAAARNMVPKLLRIGSMASFESAWFLLSPPFALAAGLAVIASAVAALAGAWVVVWIGVGALALLTLAFVIACIQARVGWRVLLAMAVAPGYIVWKLIVQAKAMLSLRGGLKEFGATARRG